MIEIEGLHKSFGRHKVLSDVTLSFDAGRAVALIGPNGSGKTTLIKVLLGLVWPDSGEMRFQGEPIKGQTTYRRHLGYMPQAGRFPDHMKVGQLFGMMKHIRSDVKPANYDLELYLDFEIDSMQNKKLSILSGGMRQKVSAALAFIFNPDVLILDEPTAGLDPVSNEVLKAKLKSAVAQGKLVIITSHVLSDLDEIVTDVAYLMDGQTLFYKSLDQLKSETDETRLNRIIAQILQNEPVDA